MNTFVVLAEPKRREILDELRREPQTVSALVDALGVSQPAVSKHLRVLRDADLVSVRPDGQRRWYEVNTGPLMELEEWLEPYRALWSERLDRLERHLDDNPGIDDPTTPEEEK